MTCQKRLDHPQEMFLFEPFDGRGRANVLDPLLTLPPGGQAFSLDDEVYLVVGEHDPTSRRKQEGGVYRHYRGTLTHSV